MDVILVLFMNPAHVFYVFYVLALVVLMGPFGQVTLQPYCAHLDLFGGSYWESSHSRQTVRKIRKKHPYTGFSAPVASLKAQPPASLNRCRYESEGASLRRQRRQL